MKNKITTTAATTNNNNNNNNIPSNIDNNNFVEIISRQQQQTPFQSKLKQLEDMGFISKTNNIEALINNNGDVLETVKELLEKKN